MNATARAFNRQLLIKKTINDDPDVVAERELEAKNLGLNLTLFHTSTPYWRIEDTTSDDPGAVLTTGFDVDLERVFELIHRGARLHEIDLYKCTDPAAAVVRTPGGAVVKQSLHQCVMCGVQGGLRSPKLIQQGYAIGIRWKTPKDPVTNEPNVYLHPGRCRKQLRNLIDQANKRALK